jgi:ferredoxin
MYDSSLDIYKRLRSEDPVFLATEACFSVRRPAMECGLCRAVCPAGVLSGGLWSIKLETAGCIGCGICAAECPTGAIRVDGFSTKIGEFTEEFLALECRRVPDALRAASAAVVPCLGGLSAADLLDHVAGSRGDVVLMDHGWCADCPVGSCASPWAASLSAAQSLLATLDKEIAPSITVKEVSLDAAKASPVAVLRPELTSNRRDFFRRLVAPAPEPHGPEESQRIIFSRGLVQPIARKRTLAVLRDLAGDEGLSPALMPLVTINTSVCDLHAICAAICPTGALRLTEPGGTSLVIDFDAEACISCGECQRVCPGKALSLKSDGDGTLPEGRKVLASRARGICMDCGDTFPQGLNDMHLYCQPCRNSQALMQEIPRLHSGSFPQV